MRQPNARREAVWFEHQRIVGSLTGTKATGRLVND